MTDEIWKLVDYDCQDGKCLMIWNIDKDSKLGALSLDHRSIGGAIVEELNDEKIDVVEYSEDPAEYISAALNPAKVLSVEIDESNKSAVVTVPEFQLSLAIGKEGQNARLAARLTGWKIDIKSDGGAFGKE